MNKPNAFIDVEWQKRNSAIILVLAIALFFSCTLTGFGQIKNTVGQWDLFEKSFDSSESYENPFMEVQLEVIFEKDGAEWKQPAFWNGGKTWTVRFAFPETGTFSYRVESNDPSLNQKRGTVDVQAYKGDNPLIKHGHLRVSENGRYFEHADGTPFFWMGDTWWKCLSKRLSFDEFKELTDDRAKKGFSLAQIVCGPYPDEDFYTDWWDNEGGKPYLNREFTKVNLEYFKYADQRFEYMVQSGIVPAIVGAWGRSDCDAMRFLGVEGMKRHWRNLIARYGAYPSVWIAGGEAGGQLWTETALYIRAADPYDRPITVHPVPHLKSVVESVGAECINFDFLQTGHGSPAEDPAAVQRIKASYNAEPIMPVLIGEHSYEQHMKFGPPYTQRYVFWGSVLSGAAGLTYGAAGIWHAGIEGSPASVNTYDFTTWRQGMDYPGSAQMGLNAQFIEKYPWEKFESRPDWVDNGLFAAGVPGEIRMVYKPRPHAYNWSGLKVYGLEKDTPYNVFFFDPSTGRTFDRGSVIYVDNKQVVFEEDFSKDNRNRWRDDGSRSKIEEGQLVTQKGAIVILKEDIEQYISVSVDAKSDAEAGIVLNYTDKNNYLVGLYTPASKRMYFHEVIDGNYGEPLGAGDGPLTSGPRILPELNENITLNVTLQNGVAMLEIKSGKDTYTTSTEIKTLKSGKIGLWQDQAGDHQKYDNFKVLEIPDREAGIRYLLNSTLVIERTPSPQDWVLVLETYSLLRTWTPGILKPEE